MVKKDFKMKRSALLGMIITIPLIGDVIPIAPSDVYGFDETNTTITLRWTDNSMDEDFFQIYRHYIGLFGNPDSYEHILTVLGKVSMGSMITATITDLMPNNFYSYAVSALILNAGESSKTVMSPEFAGTTHTWSGIMQECVNEHISGNAPDDIPTRQELENIYVFSCNARGLTTIDSALNDLTNVVSLDLSDNNITGSIPSWIDNFSSLHTLTLNNNQLSGAIPTEIGILDAMTWLDLSYNYLNGTIPSEITSLTSIGDEGYKLNLNYNCNISSSNTEVQSFIDLKSSTSGGYAFLLETNGHCPPSSNSYVNVPILMYLLD